MSCELIIFGLLDLSNQSFQITKAGADGKRMFRYFFNFFGLPVFGWLFLFYLYQK
jgi:hypothetical protein